MKKEDLRIVFLGTPDFAVESLRRIHENGYNIVGVITMPDKIGGRGHRMIESPVKQYAVANGLHLMQPANLKDPQFIAELRSLNANLFIVIAFRMLPEIVWQMPALGTFNLHASLLPRYRGAAPINRAVMNGDTTTGVTTFFLKHEIDTGDILQQASVTIGEDENVGSVHDRLMTLGAELTIETIERIIDGTLHPMPQDELAKKIEPTPAPKIFKEDCAIDWNKSTDEIHNHVRGLSPYPAAWTTLYDENGEVGQIKIFETRKVATPSNQAEPGSATVENGRLLVTTSTPEKSIEILSMQLQGKKRMTTSEFLRGRHTTKFHLR